MDQGQAEIFIYLFISSRLTSVSHEGYVDKIKHARKKQEPIHNIVESKQTQMQRQATNNPPPSAVGFTHSGDEAPLVRK
jgi:hypothetical protein